MSTVTLVDSTGVPVTLDMTRDENSVVWTVSDREGFLDEARTSPRDARHVVVAILDDSEAHCADVEFEENTLRVGAVYIPMTDESSRSAVDAVLDVLL